MKKIEIDGQEYEVLPYDNLEGCTHAQLAGGKVRPVVVRGISGNNWFNWTDTKQTRGVYISDIEDLGITPLKLIEKAPVEFVGVTHGYQTAGRDGFDLRITVSQDEINRLLGLGVTLNRTFRCVEVVE